MSQTPALIDALRACVGKDHLLSEPTEVAPFCTDWRGRFHGLAAAVVSPASTQEVAAVVRACSAQGAPVVPQGGNTGLAGGATPDGSGRAVVVSTRRMRQVRSIDLADDTITAECGCLLQEVQDAALARRRLFPLSLAAQGSCTIGGNLSTNAGGTQVLRYGNARELTLGLEVVLADGRIWNGLRGLRKDNTGLDLRQAFIGAEGTLGIITAATLRLFPLPASQATVFAAVPGIEQAIALLQLARARAGADLTAFELVSQPCIALLRALEPGVRLPFAEDPPWLCLLEWSAQDAQAALDRRVQECCEDALDSGSILDAAFASGGRDREAMWHVRETIPLAQARAGGNVKHDISLPLGQMAAFLSQLPAVLETLDPRLQPYVFGHLGDGNLHCNVGVRPGDDAAQAFALEARINDIVFGAAIRAGGSISAEHGVGQLRRELAQRTRDGVEIDLQRAIKRALDPQGIMNPGKGLG